MNEEKTKQAQPPKSRGVAHEAKTSKSRGATAVEYALIVALIAAVIIIAVGSLGTKTQGLYNTTTTEMSDAGI